MTGGNGEDCSPRLDAGNDDGSRAQSGSVEIVVCETCRHPNIPEGEGGRTAGAAFADRLQAALAAYPDLANVRLTTMHCLMSCRRPCAVHVRAPGKMAYVLGDLAPDPEAAETLAAYVRTYRESADGVVPFRLWPEGVKGRFVARVPPLPG